MSIEQVWAKKVWELCGSSETNVLNLQKKNGVVYNIRPKNWYNKDVDIFKSRRDFVTALSGAITKFGVQDLDGRVWFNDVSDLYLKRTGLQL